MHPGTPSRSLRLVLCLASSCLAVSASFAQDAAKDPAKEAAKEREQSAPVASASSSEVSEVPEVPGLSGLLRGVNAGLTLAGVHDAATGWSTSVQPAIGFSFNSIFSVDVTVPVYMYRLAESTAANPRPNALLLPQRAEIGDVIFSGHAQFEPRGTGYQATFTVTAPTGDAEHGLSTGRPTVDFSNRLEREFQHLTPEVELGVGDSSSLVNPLVRKNYTSLGPLAHFQAGLAIPLFLGVSISAGAYEELPVGDQKIYTSTTRRGKTTTVVSGRSVSEDNGFISSLDVPIDPHTTLSTYYSHSLRLHDDIVAIGLTYVLRGSHTREEKAGQDALQSTAP